MFKTRVILLSLLTISLFAWISFSGLWKLAKSRSGIEKPRSYTLAATGTSKIKSKAEEAKTFATQKGFNPQICLLVDMSMASGQNRFFVYDMIKDTIRNSGLVTHGRCNQWWLEGRKYGNTVGCGCTSLGRYKIGHSYQGRFGLAYKLYGLDKTNDKAFQRFVVLHSHACVPESEVKDEICQSDGCPTVSVNFLKYLKPIIDNSGKPVLLWIFE